MRIILLGPPGCGKGTQGDLIRNKYGFPRIVTGDLLRRAVREGTPLGREAEAAMKHGGLVSDAIVIGLVKARLAASDCRKGYVLDGFPRNINQARTLDSIDGFVSESVLEIALEESVLVERLSGRRICPKCGAVFNSQARKPIKEGICDICGTVLIQREDDWPEVIQERLRVYREQTEPLRNFYRAKGVFHKLEGNRSIESVFDDICAVLDAAMAKIKGAEVPS